MFSMKISHVNLACLECATKVGQDKTVRIWNTATGEMHNKIEEHKEICSSVGWLPDSKRFISGANDSWMVWNCIKQNCCCVP